LRNISTIGAPGTKSLKSMQQGKFLFQKEKEKRINFGNNGIVLFDQLWTYKAKIH